MSFRWGSNSRSLISLIGGKFGKRKLGFQNIKIIVFSKFKIHVATEWGRRKQKGKGKSGNGDGGGHS